MQLDIYAEVHATYNAILSYIIWYLGNVGQSCEHSSAWFCELLCEIKYDLRCHLIRSGEKNLKKKKSFSPPPPIRSPPTTNSRLETPYRFKKRDCIHSLTFIQHCHRKQITFSSALCHTMLRMLKKYQLHPGIIILSIWLSHFIEDHKVQGK